MLILFSIFNFKRSLFFFSFLILNNSSLFSTVNGPIGVIDEGIANSSKDIKIIAVNVITNEISSFENATINSVVRSLSSGNYEIKIQKSNSTETISIVK